MHYKKLSFEHSKILKSVLHDVYILSSSHETTYSTAPNGLIGITVTLEGVCTIRHKGMWLESPMYSIYGLIESPDLIKISAHYKEVAFGFKPAFFQLLTRESMSNIIGAANLDASFVFNKNAVERLAQKLSESTSEAGFIAAIEEFVVSQLLESEYDAKAVVAMKLIYSEKNKSVEDIANYLNLSTTTLRKLFLQKIGRSPKAISNIIRVNRILTNYAPASAVNLQDMAFENNFFDLAHFSNSFKKTVGLSANKYFKDTRLTFDFYNLGRWQGDIFAAKENS